MVELTEISQDDGGMVGFQSTEETSVLVHYE